MYLSCRRDVNVVSMVVLLKTRPGQLQAEHSLQDEALEKLNMSELSPHEKSASIYHKLGDTEKVKSEQGGLCFRAVCRYQLATVAAPTTPVTSSHNSFATLLHLPSYYTYQVLKRHNAGELETGS